ncbi:MAG: Ig-like domain-containing protein [Verrucomicrobiae bacterium]|nr:Ig-like domain-containing protein [Verrucomicrobiae bacterium]
MRLLRSHGTPTDAFAGHTRSDSPHPADRVRRTAFDGIAHSTVAAAALLLVSIASVSAEIPRIAVELDLPSALRLSWPGDAGGVVLEESAELGSRAQWEPASRSPSLIGGRHVVALPASGHGRYFRLRLVGGGLTTLVETSPVDGEDGVSVTRECLLRFSGALSPGTILTLDRFHAEALGRRLLSRVELSSDRRTASLFFLENLPASAQVHVTFDATGVLDEQGLEVDADGDGVPGGVARLRFRTFSTTPIPGTAIHGRVFASEPVPGVGPGASATVRPLQGVTVTVDGAEESLRTTTDATGKFTLDPAPAGRFFVHVDGRTAVGSEWPNGGYYPVVGKAWETLAGHTDNLAGGTGEIYLPWIPSDALRAVSATEDTVVTFPEHVVQNNPALAGVSITIPANTLFANDGTRGGRVGIAAVPPDRLPEPLPPGLAFPIVITVQTDGPSNFDVPIPVRFPNLPDPATGDRLPPGARSALWSFDHDLGRWEIQGPMIVTTDGEYLEPEPGVGIRQPGWHGVQPGSQGVGPEGPPAPDDCHSGGSGCGCPGGPNGLNNTQRGRGRCVVGGGMGAIRGCLLNPFG